ncbi:MAG: DUF5317 domain-containing protein [Chloroflexi bacterium]|nr:DUF5317 domain-containing protein [Chloroflexota bacterium]
MLFFVPGIVLGIVAGLIRGGNLSRLAQLRFRCAWLIITAFLVQVLIFSPISSALPANELAVPVLHILSNLALIGALALNWRIAGMQLVALGLLLNFAAIAANGGYMPVSGEVLDRAGRAAELQELRATGHVAKAALLTDETRLPFLGDLYEVGIPPIKGRVFSIGDVLISIGAFVLLVAGMRRG